MAKIPTQAAQRRLEYVPLDELVPAERNPKRHDLPAIGRSIDRFGYVEPIVLDERTGRLVAGHGRLEQLSAAKASGSDAPEGVTVDGGGAWQVPVLRGWASRSDADAEAYLAASNRLVELGGWDDAELGALLADLTAVDADLAAVAGFDPAELARLLLAAQRGPERRTDPDDVPDVPAEPVTRPGDVWLLGPHRLVCGDSTDPAVVDSALAGDHVDCVWTDPPYGIAFKALRRSEAIANDGDLATAEATIREALRPLSAAPAAFVCCDWRSLPMVLAAMGKIDLAPKACIVWDKGHGVQNLDRFAKSYELIVYAGPFGGEPTVSRDVWSVARDYKPDHPTPKPVELITRSLEAATVYGALVADPFAGSGSTLIACHATGRLARLVELDPAYCDVICRRYQEHTGDKPILEATGAAHDFTVEQAA